MKIQYQNWPTQKQATGWNDDSRDSFFKYEYTRNRDKINKWEAKRLDRILKELLGRLKEA